MGSAQSARRIQPGGVVRPCRRFPGGSFPLPVPPDPSTRASPRPLPSRGGAPAARGRGRGWGRRGTAPRPATGRRRAHFRRGGAPRPAPGRLGRPGGEGGSGRAGVVTPRGPPGHPAPSVTAPRQQPSPNPGAEERQDARRDVLSRRALLPRPRAPPARPSPPRPLGGPGLRGAAGPGSGRGFLAGPPLPRRDRSPTLASPRLPPLRGVCARGPGAGRTVPSAPRASWRRRVRGKRSRDEKRAHGVGGDVGHPPDPS